MLLPTPPQELGRDTDAEDAEASAAAALAGVAGLAGSGAPPAVALKGRGSGSGSDGPLTGVDLQLARQEYLTYGQQVRP